jgi:hypothetical protein
VPGKMSASAVETGQNTNRWIKERMDAHTYFEHIYNGRALMRGSQRDDRLYPLVPSSHTEIRGVQGSVVLLHQSDQFPNRVSALRMANKVHFIGSAPRPPLGKSA